MILTECEKYQDQIVHKYQARLAIRVFQQNLFESVRQLQIKSERRPTKSALVAVNNFFQANWPVLLTHTMSKQN